jgi:nucleoside phosphorylase
MKRTLIFLVCIALFSSLVFAHGNEKHVIGTVTQVSQDSVTVQTSPNETVEVLIASDTKFMKGSASAAAKDIQVGDRVVIHAMPRKDGKLVAHTVQIGVVKAPAPSR